MVVIYTLANCSTCRAATKWLGARKIAFEERAIRETPPTAAEVTKMLRAHDGNLRKVFNTAGLEYRALGLSAKLDTLSEADAVKLLSSNGSLVKRPFVLGPSVALTGFAEKVWSAARWS